VKRSYGLEQARAKLPNIAADAHAGHTSLITRHGVPIAAVVPLSTVQRDLEARQARGSGVLALRGTGRQLWPAGAGHTVANLRDEWQE
jgi:antitoxin (DNA-binding transcriptional repressor) of toxin-antitoxin stability system